MRWNEKTPREMAEGEVGVGELSANGVLRQITPCDIERPYIFISYSSADSDLVWRDVLEFQKRGFNIWLDEKNLDKTKSSWKNDALEAVQDIDCRMVVFYVSASSLRSENCYQEMSRTMQPTAVALHRGPVKFIAVEVEQIGDIRKFSERVFEDIQESGQDKSTRQAQAMALDGFMTQFFNSNNEKVRIHPKNELDRKLDYYEEIVAAFPDKTRVGFCPGYEPKMPVCPQQEESHPNETPQPQAQATAKERQQEGETAAPAARPEETASADPVQGREELLQSLMSLWEARPQETQEALEELPPEQPEEPEQKPEEPAAEPEEPTVREEEPPLAEEPPQNDLLAAMMAQLGEVKPGEEKVAARREPEEAPAEPAASVRPEETAQRELMEMLLAQKQEALKNEPDKAEPCTPPQETVDEDWYTQARPHKKEEQPGRIFTKKDCARILARQSIVRMGNEYTAIDTPLFGSVFAGNQEVRCIVLSNRLYRLHSGQFERCRKLREVDLPVYLEELPERVLMDCSSLQKLSVPGGVKRIGASAAAGCTELKHLRLPLELEELGEAVFSGCEALEELHLPPRLRRMGASCFHGCRALEEVAIPGSLRVLPERAFRNCADLEKVVLHAGVERIGAEAFASAESDALLHVWIPETVTDIAPGAFERPGGAVLHGAGGSAAAAYAKKNQLPFRPE